MGDDPTNGEEAGRAFLAANKGKADVHVLPSGLQYKVLVEGAGLKHPTKDSPCDCHYAGTLLDGTMFDSSYKRGKPSTFAPNQVIKGWTEAMQLMVVGDKWEMYIPYELAYGASGKPPKIPPKAMLIFVMEIVRIKGDSVPITFPRWTDDDLALWTAKDDAACDDWRSAKQAKYDGGDAKLLAKYPDAEAFGAWLDKQCAATKNQALWKRSKAAKKAKAGGSADAPTAPEDSKPKMNAKIARTILDGALDAITRPANKEKLVKLVSDIEATGDESQKGMLRMVKLMPAVSDILAPVLEDSGYGKDDLMTVAMQLQGFASEDPSIGVDTMKLIKAAQGDLSDFV